MDIRRRGATPPPTIARLQCTSVFKGGKRFSRPRAFIHVVDGVPNVPGRD